MCAAKSRAAPSREQKHVSRRSTLSRRKVAHATALPGRRQPGAELAVHELAVHGDGGEARGGGDLEDGGRLLRGGARGAGSARRG